LAQFIEAYRGERQSKKQEAAKNFDRHMALLQQGLPGYNLKMMAKWANEAGMEFDYDAPAMPQQAPAGAQGGMMPQGGGVPTAGGAAPAMGGQGAPPPPPPPGMPQQGPPMQMQGPPPGMPQGGPPQGGGQGGGIFSRLGRAMGVPQPPSQSQQQGALAMLQEMQKRGAMNSDMQGLQNKIALRALTLTEQLSEMERAGIPDDSPEKMKAIAELQRLTGGLQGAAGDAESEQLARAKFGPVYDRMEKEKLATEREKQSRESRKLAFEAVKTGKLSPEQVTQAVGYIDGTVELPPDMGGKSGEDIIGIVTGLQGAFPEAPEEALRTVVTLALDENPNVRAITSAMGQLGSSREKLQLQMQKEVAAFRARSDARAEEQIQMTREDRAKDKELDKVTGSVLALALGDVDKAYDEALLYTRLATGFDLEKSEAMLPRVQKVLKDLSKNPDALERMMAKLLEQQQQKAEQ